MYELSNTKGSGASCGLFALRVCIVFVGLVVCPSFSTADTDTEPESTDTASASQDFVPPKLVSEVQAVYPQEAFENNIEATVGLMLYIDAEGRVVKSEIVEPAEDDRFDFDENAQAAFDGATFEPARQDGEPLAVKFQINYEFRIHFEEPVLEAVVQADYPEAALREGITDSVLAELDVDERGKVTAVRLTQTASRPEYRFDAPALEALQQFSFKPAMKNGIPVPVTVIYKYDFVLPEKWVPPSERPVNLIIELKERGTRIPVESGFISLKKGDAPPIEETFAGGVYKGRGLAPGQWEVLIEAEGYAPIETTETVIEGKAVAARYLIERESYDVLDASGESNADGELVYETREARLEKEIDVKTLKVSEIQRIPGNNGDAIKVVQNLPGVSRSTFNTGAVIIRGSAPSDSEILLDGVPIPLIYHFGGLASTVNSDALKEINFLPGNFSVKYGRAMGGVIDVRTRRPNSERYTGYIDVDTTDGSLMLEGPIVDNLSFFASVRRSWFDSILKMALSGDDLTMTTAPRYWDYQLRFNWFSDKKQDSDPVHELDVMVYGSDDRMKMLEADDFSFELTTAFHHVKLTWGVDADTFENDLIFDMGQDRYYQKEEAMHEEKIVLMRSIRDDFTLHLNHWLDIMAGFDFQIEAYRVDVNAPQRGLEQAAQGEMPDNDHMSDGNLGGRDPDDTYEMDETPVMQKVDGTRFLPGVYLAFGFRPIDKLRFTVGSRFDYDSLSDDWSIDLRGTARFQAHKYVALTGGAGTFHQPPTEQMLSEGFGNPDLTMQRAIHFSLGTETRMPFYEALSLNVTGFYKMLDDLVTPSDALVERDGLAVMENYNNKGEGRVYGGEFLLRHDLTHHFFGWISYTLSRSERKRDSGDAWNLFEYDQTHILTLLGSYKLPRGFQVGLRFRYVTGTPFTPLSTGVFDSDAELYEAVRGKYQSDRNAAYHQLDLRIDKDWVFDYWIFTAYLDIQNVYYHANEEIWHYSYDYSEKTAIKGLPIQPSFGLRGAF